MHYRQRIRDAVRNALLAADTKAGQNVFTSRARPVLEILQKREAVLSVYTADESSEVSGDSHLLVRKLVVSIEGMAGGGDDLDDYLDDFAEQVEAAVDADPDLGNLLHSEMLLVSTTSEISARGNMQVGAFRLDYECEYLTRRIPLEPDGPVPDRVYTNPQPHAERYREMFDEPAAQPPGGLPWGGPGDAPACDGGVCAPPAWGGDLTDAGTPRPPVPAPAPEPEPGDEEPQP